MTCYTKKHHIPFEIDDEDYDRVMKHGWWCHLEYFSTEISGKCVKLHRFIMNPPDDMQIDHKNGDKSDNHKANLRICTISQNQHNQK